MSDANNCQCACPTPVVSPVPGTEGAPGTDGDPGAAGADGYTYTNGVAGPFDKGDTGIQITVLNSTAFAIGLIVGIEAVVGGTSVGYFQVTSKATHQLTLTFLDISANADASSIATDKLVVVAGPQVDIGALPTALTDNSGGTQSNTIAAGVGCRTLAFYIEAASIANGDLLTEYVPGYAFKIVKFDARCAKTVSTGGKAASLNLEIGSTNLTGGAIALSGTYALGAAQAGTAVTAGNTGSATDSFSIEASGVTAFTEGAFWLIIEIQNLDERDAIASLAKHVNDLISAL